MAVDQAGVVGPRSLGYWRGFDRTVPGGWVALVLRLGLAAVWLTSGLHTITDLAQSRAAVGAYKLFPYEVNVVIGSAQPIIETLLGLALLIGVAIRVSAVVSVVLFAVFIAGIISVWARGMRIDCGCFSSGGQLAANQGTTYGWDILRDVGFIVLALLVFLWSRSRFSVDSLLFPAVPADDEDGDE